MQYFINKKDGSHCSMAAGYAPDGCKKVSKTVYEKFVNGIDEKKRDFAKARRARKRVMLSGFDFEGVTVSATKKDVAGLISVEMSIKKGFFKQTVFKFVNGSDLQIDSKNIDDILEKVSLFRQKIFTEEG